MIGFEPIPIILQITAITNYATWLKYILKKMMMIGIEPILQAYETHELNLLFDIYFYLFFKYKI